MALLRTSLLSYRELTMRVMAQVLDCAIEARDDIIYRKQSYTISIELYKYIVKYYIYATMSRNIL